MVNSNNHSSSSQPVLTGEAKAVRYLEQAIASGENWYIALLEAICQWENPEETNEGTSGFNLIDNEALDWLVLAKRLCQAVDGLLPNDEKMALLFNDKPPVKLTPSEFKDILGTEKYHQYLNYFYGITVEEALVLALEEEVRKEKWISGYTKEQGITNEVHRRIYGASRNVLLKRFRQEKNYQQLNSIKLSELKEFTYWLFKHRIKHSEKTKVASDTKKALDWLQKNGISRQLQKNGFSPDYADIIPNTTPEPESVQD